MKKKHSVRKTHRVGFKINEEFRPFIELVQFIDRYPPDDNHCIVGMSGEKACAACHLTKPVFEGILDNLKDRGYLTYISDGDIYNITLLNWHFNKYGGTEN